MAGSVSATVTGDWLLDNWGETTENRDFAAEKSDSTGYENETRYKRDVKIFERHRFLQHVTAFTSYNGDNIVNPSAKPFGSNDLSANGTYECVEDGLSQEVSQGDIMRQTQRLISYGDWSEVTE